MCRLRNGSQRATPKGYVTDSIGAATKLFAVSYRSPAKLRSWLREALDKNAAAVVGFAEVGVIVPLFCGWRPDQTADQTVESSESSTQQKAPLLLLQSRSEGPKNRSINQSIMPSYRRYHGPGS